MKISGVKKIEQKVFKNSKGDLLKFVSKKSKYFKSFGEIYFNEIKQSKKKGGNLYVSKSNVADSVCTLILGILYILGNKRRTDGENSI